ncbi:MAG: hypothetical protein P1V97_32415 [Planctomycetota bacterium]|nr:hypothetical protein [Planctomycetota bacterium]
MRKNTWKASFIKEPIKHPGHKYFSWYKPPSDWDWCDTKVSPKTPRAEIHKALLKKKLKDKEAKALMTWLEDDIVLLLPK